MILISSPCREDWEDPGMSADSAQSSRVRAKLKPKQLQMKNAPCLLSCSPHRASLGSRKSLPKLHQSQGIIQKLNELLTNHLLTLNRTPQQIWAHNYFEWIIRKYVTDILISSSSGPGSRRLSQLLLSLRPPIVISLHNILQSCIMLHNTYRGCGAQGRGPGVVTRGWGYWGWACSTLWRSFICDILCGGREIVLFLFLALFILWNEELLLEV